MQDGVVERVFESFGVKSVNRNDLFRREFFDKSFQSRNAGVS